MILYRVVRSSEPVDEDFMSDEAKGKPPVPVQVREPVLYRGISMWDSLDSAVETARAWRLGDYVAELDIDSGEAVVVTKTRGPGHYTVEGSPALLRSLIRQIHEVESVK